MSKRALRRLSGSPPARHVISIRDLRRDEGDLLDDLVARMSPQCRYLRFHSPVHALTRMRCAMLDLDGRDHIAR